MDALISRHFIALFMILLFSIRLLSEQSKENSELRYFWLTVICCFFLIVEDQLENYTSKDPDLRFLRTFLSVAGYILRSTASVGLVLAVINPEYNHKKVWIPNIVNILVCCTAFFSDIVFGFDADYRFYRGPLGYVPFVIPVLYLAMILWITFRNYNRYNGRYSRLLLSACAVFCLLSAMLDALYGGVRLHDAIIISSIFFFTFLQSYSQKQREAEKKRKYLLENIDRTAGRSVTKRLWPDGLIRWKAFYRRPISSLSWRMPA